MTARRAISLAIAILLAALPARRSGAETLHPGAAAVAATAPEGATEAEDSLFEDGISAFGRGDYASASAAFAAFAKTFPASGRIPDARFIQAKALVMQARFEDAIVVLDTFLELSPNGPHSFEALMLRGEALIAASPVVPHFSDAAISFAMALETDTIPPDGSIDATLHLADALLRMGDKAGAAQAFGRLSAFERRRAAMEAEARGFWRVAKFRPVPKT